MEPRILLSEHLAIAKLCDEYCEKVACAAGGSNSAERYYSRRLPSGLPFDNRMLRLYREALGKWQLDQGPEPPSPFGPEGEDGFVKWLNTPMGQTKKPVTRYMLAVMDDREDVRNAFPDPLGADSAGFRNWYLLYGLQELELPEALVPLDARIDDAADGSRAPGEVAANTVNVAGYFRAELGLGVAARSILSALEAARIPLNTISFDATANRQSYPFEDRTAAPPAADINIVCVNPDQLPAFSEQAGPEFRRGRYTISVWFWEVEDFPRSFQDIFDHVDEVWVARPSCGKHFSRCHRNRSLSSGCPLSPRKSIYLCLEQI